MDSSDRSNFDSSLASDTEREAISAMDNRVKKGQHSKAAQSLTSFKKQFVKKDIEVIVGWLEHPTHFSWVFGTARPTFDGKHPRMPVQGWAEVAKAVNKRRKGLLSVTGKTVRDRFYQHIKTYSLTKEKSTLTGFGLTAKDRDNNINTIDQKLESLCFCYGRMDNLFSVNRNVKGGFPEVASGLVEKNKDESSLKAKRQDVLKQRAEVQGLPNSTQELKLDAELVLNLTLCNTNNSKPGNDNTNNSTPGNDNTNNSLATTSSTSSILSGTAKRARCRSETTDTDSSARPSRAKNSRRAPPRLKMRPPPATSENAIAAAFKYMADARWKDVETAKLTWKIRKWELDREQEKQDQERDRTVQKREMILLGMEKGYDPDHIKAMLDLAF
ncbi:hypothetical protein EDD11_010063 [Mortierella claussenii]|nr:hypothetical protein EDD11_010063 [Mortierella claussenii]